MMKKTLVALAAVAVTSGAFAQATMTGSLAYGYRQTQLSTGVTAGGIGANAANIDFAVTEDIEGLGKVSGKMGIASKNSDSSAAARDSSLKLDMGSAGAITMNAVYSYTWLADVAAPGSVAACSFTNGDCTTGIGMFSTYGYNDNISYSLPISSSLSVSVSHTEPNAAASGIGAGAAGATISDAAYSGRYNTYSATYNAAPLVVTGGYRTYDLAQLATGNSNYRHRAAFSYDLGAAKIGAGYEQTTTTYGATTTDTLFSVAMAVPNSALTVSAQFGQRARAGNASASSDTVYAGSAYAASYKLSGRTSLNTTYLTNQSSGTSNPTFFLATINHTF